LAAELDPNKVTPGLLGFLVVFGLAVATWFLLRSMNRQLKKIDFDEQAVPQVPADAGASVDSGDSADRTNGADRGRGDTWHADDAAAPLANGDPPRGDAPPSQRG
jgi:hypothetical protein